LASAQDLSTELIAGVGGWQRAVQAQEQRLREMLADLSVQVRQLELTHNEYSC
jgi:hypothetical protein